MLEMGTSLSWIAFGLMCCFKVATCVHHDANITSSPQSVNTTLNGTAIFNCTYDGDVILWRANGQRINNSLNGYEITDVPLTSISAMSTLTVVTSLDKNNTNITCNSIAQGSDFIESEPALLLLQGLLESVSNLTVTLINSTTVLISWSPPFTLEGVPILGYNFTITNTTSGKNETMLVEDTTLLYSIDHPDPENNFTVTVVPINEVGAGQPATFDSLNFETTPTYSSTLPQPFSSLMLITSIMMSTQSFLIAPMSSMVTVTSTGTVAATDTHSLPIGAVVGVSVGMTLLLVLIGTCMILVCVAITLIYRRKKFAVVQLESLAPLEPLTCATDFNSLANTTSFQASETFEATEGGSLKQSKKILFLSDRPALFGYEQVSSQPAEKEKKEEPVFGGSSSVQPSTYPQRSQPIWFTKPLRGRKQGGYYPLDGGDHKGESESL